MNRKTLAAKTWNTKAYYQRIKKIDDLSHPALGRIESLCRKSISILDVGCGDGRKLALLGNDRTYKTGVDVSAEAIRLAKKQLPKGKFIISAGEDLPFSNNSFEAVVSTFTIEHVTNPGKMVSEMIRVALPMGLVIILAPNYGAPNRSSPNFQGSRLTKLFKGFILDLISNDLKLNWNRVVPKAVNMDVFQSDQDTTIEPYLLSLVKFVKQRGVTIMIAESYWSMELSGATIWQQSFRQLGMKGIFPFKYWGPHLFLVAQKK